jgi:hypothetical protein
MRQPQIWFELGYKISSFLGFLDEYYSSKTLTGGSFLDPERDKCSQVWAMIFKTGKWLEKAVETGLRPALFGHKLTALYNGEKKPANLALVVSDQSRDSRSFSHYLFESLQDHTYDEKGFQVRLKSGITLNIYDVIKCDEGIMIAEPQRLFQRCRKGIYSTALYYGERTLRDIQPQYIGGINGVGPTKISEIRDICSIEFQLANEKPVYRSLIKQGATTKVVPIRREDSDVIIAYRPPLAGEAGAAVEAAIHAFRERRRGNGPQADSQE